MRYIETGPKSPKNQKFIDTYFQESTFTKIAPYFRSDQTKPNQTKPSGILHSAHHHVRAYQKKFQPSSSIGGRENWSGSFKIWKMLFFGFFEKGPPGAPKKVKNQFQWYFWVSGTQMAYQKNFRQFSGRGGEKCVHADWTAPVGRLD